MLQESPRPFPRDHFDYEDTNSKQENKTKVTLHIPNSTYDDIDSESSHFAAEMTGDLYTAVRKGSTGSLRFSESNNNSPVIQSKQSSDLEDSKHSTLTNEASVEQRFSGFKTFGDPEGSDGSLFSDILTRFDRHFSREDGAEGSDAENNCYDDNDSEKNTDTAYNSAANSENSSLERKPKSNNSSRSQSTNDIDATSEATDFLISPLEDTQTFPGPGGQGHPYPIDAEVITESTGEMLQVISENINIEETNDKGDYLSVNPTSKSASTSRDQCDSAIYEAESLTDDGEDTTQMANHKLEQLRTHLVKLKEKR